MTDHQPRPGLCMQCMANHRAPGCFRCKDCQDSWASRSRTTARAILAEPTKEPDR